MNISTSYAVVSAQRLFDAMEKRVKSYDVFCEKNPNCGANIDSEREQAKRLRKMATISLWGSFNRETAVIYLCERDCQFIGCL